MKNLFGTLFRINRVNEQKNINLQTWTPIIRCRISNSKHLYILSYSFDANVSQSMNSVQYGDASTTHEVGFVIYLFSGNNRSRDCAAFKQMETSALYQDIMKNGLLK